MLVRVLDCSASVRGSNPFAGHLDVKEKYRLVDYAVTRCFGSYLKSVCRAHAMIINKPLKVSIA